MSRHLAFALLLATLACPAAAYAGDPLGTAGPFRTFGFTQCAAGYEAQFNGGCDPPPVNSTLPMGQQSKAHVERALALVGLGRLQQARESLDEAVRTDDRNVTAFKLRARIASPGNGSAESDVNAGLRLDPNDPDLLAMRATFLENRNPVAALDEATRAITINPRNADALWIRAGILLRSKKLEEAESDLAKALAVEPDLFRARHLRGAVRLHRNHFRDAFEDANAAVAQHPGDPSALHLRAMARAGLGDFTGLVDDLTTVLGEPGQPVNADPSLALFNGLYIQRAIALVRLGRQLEATQDLDTITQLGGQRAILRMQVYLRSNGFRDVPIDGKRSDLFYDAMKACFIDQACGRGIAERI